MVYVFATYMPHILHPSSNCKFSVKSTKRQREIILQHAFAIGSFTYLCGKNSFSKNYSVYGENYISTSIIQIQSRLHLLIREISRIFIRHAIVSRQINRAHVKAHTFCHKEED